MADEPKLNPYARRFADRLFAQWPEWEALSETDDDGHLYVTVPCPNPAVVHPLYIRADGEITVGIDRHHTHFHMFQDEDENEAFAMALEHIEGIIAEEKIIGAQMLGDKWLQSFGRSADAPLDVSPGPGEYVYVRSWQGTRDKEFRGPAT